MENSSVILFEAVIITHNTEKEILILCEISCGGQQPTIAEFTLLHIEAWVALDKELRIFANFGRSQPLVMTIGTSWEKQALVVRLKLGILEQCASVETMLTKLIVILHILLLSPAAASFADLELIILISTRIFYISAYKKITR